MKLLAKLFSRNTELPAPDNTPIALRSRLSTACERAKKVSRESHATIGVIAVQDGYKVQPIISRNTPGLVAVYYNGKESSL